MALSPAAPSQDPLPIAKLLAFYGELPLAPELLSAFESEERDPNAGFYALAVTEQMRDAGKVADAQRVVDEFLARFEDETTLRAPLLQMRADLRRHLGDFGGALEDLEEAERHASAFTEPRLVSWRVHLVRTMTYVGFGLPDLASHEFLKAETVKTELLEQLSREPANELLHINHAGLLRETPLCGYAVDLLVRDHEGAVERLTQLLSDATLTQLLGEHAPASAAGIRLNRAIARNELARDLAAEEKQGEAAKVREEALGDLKAAFAAGEVRADGKIHALLTRADLFFQLGNEDAEQKDLDELERMRTEQASDFGPEEEARLAAFRARRLLRAVDPEYEDLELADDELKEAYDRVELAWMSVEDRPQEGLGYLHLDVQTLVLGTRIDVAYALDGLPGARRALDFLARAEGLGTLAHRVGGEDKSDPNAAVSLAQSYRSSLPPGSGIVVFLPSLDTTHVLAADAQGVVPPERVGSRRAVEHLARGLMLDVARPPLPGKGQTARAQRIAAKSALLGSELFPPAIAERVAGWDRIIFVGAELLGWPALEVVPLKGKPVGLTHATSYLPGLALGEALRVRWPAPRDALAVTWIAGPERERDGLVLTSEEVDLLRGLASPGRLRSGPEATLKVDVAQDSVLGILAHGSYVRGLSRPAHIALAPSGGDQGLVGCADLEQSRLPPLVLLLTCQGANGPMARGDPGAAHLGGAALVGGAEAVLIAPNDISLASSLALSETLVSALRAGATPDEALLQARIAVRARAGLEDPYHWASLRLFGVGHLPLVEAAD